MPEPTGRREANKQAVRDALTAAAQRLFAERGYEATTVRDIAAAAQVTERTFYRYFEGKEGLLAGEFQAWISVLAEAIRDRPAGEPPLTAVRNAMLATIRQLGARTSAGQAAQAALWPFQEHPFAGLRHAAPRPLLWLENSVADAVLDRLRAGQTTDEMAGGGRPGDGLAGDGLAGDGLEYRAQVIARVAVAALRGAAIRRRQLARRGEPRTQTVAQLLDEAFTIICGDTALGLGGRVPRHVRPAAGIAGRARVAGGGISSGR